MGQLINISFLLMIFLLPTVSIAQETSSIFESSGINVAGAKLEKTDMNITLQSTNIKRFWVNAGLGVGTPGIAGIVSTSYQFLGSNLLTLRGAATGELFGDDLWDIGLLYGRATTAQDYHASISVGMAVMGGSRSTGGLFSDTPREEISHQFGFPIEGQLFWRHFRIIGLGMSGFVNINEERSFAGLAACLQVGKLK